jgi:hypothetical protein
LIGRVYLQGNIASLPVEEQWSGPLSISYNRQITKYNGIFERELNAQADENPTNRVTQNENAKADCMGWHEA